MCVYVYVCYSVCMQVSELCVRGGGLSYMVYVVCHSVCWRLFCLVLSYLITTLTHRSLYQLLQLLLHQSVDDPIRFCDVPFHQHLGHHAQSLGASPFAGGVKRPSCFGRFGSTTPALSFLKTGFALPHTRISNRSGRSVDGPGRMQWFIQTASTRTL